MDSKRYITFKIETAENMSKDKIILLAHPENFVTLSRLLLRLQETLENYEGED
jgi:hypothetical protein